jgi:predicted dehydrogenase
MHSNQPSLPTTNTQSQTDSTASPSKTQANGALHATVSINSSSTFISTSYSTAPIIRARSPPLDAPRILIVGAGSRGHGYASVISVSGLAHIAAVAEPDAFKRRELGRKFIWGPLGREEANQGEEFEDWRAWVAWEKERKEGRKVDAVFVCVLDELHREVVEGIVGLGVHIMCEKPLATSLTDTLSIYASLLKSWSALGRKTVFGICHVLRYSPHNILLRKLVREDEVIGDVVSVEHTEPIGYWHFSHSYVRGNWRREDTSAPSLLTKSCHDLDFLMWLLCSPTNVMGDEKPHLPSKITSTGHLGYFRKARKPKEAGNATNCFSCPIEKECVFSARDVYIRRLEKGDMGWPVKIVAPDIEDVYRNRGKAAAVEKLTQALKEDYNEAMPKNEVAKRNWFGRCVWECDNDVCDDQTVTVVWDDEFESNDNERVIKGRARKMAVMHMIAQTEKICERRGHIYGTKGEIAYDSETITVHDFKTGKMKVHYPPKLGGGHGGGDDGLATNFITAVTAVKSGKMEAVEAQKTFLGADLEEVVRSHCAVWAAEEARGKERTVSWVEWWDREVIGTLEKFNLCNVDFR